VNHTRFPKKDHLPDWARRDNTVTKGDRVEAATYTTNTRHEHPTPSSEFEPAVAAIERPQNYALDSGHRDRPDN